MTILEEAIKKFEKMPGIVKAIFNDKTILSKIQNLEIKYNIALSPFLIYVAIGEVDDVYNFVVREFNFEDVRAQKLTEELNKEILIPIEQILLFINLGDEMRMTFQEENQYAIKIFKELLPNILTSENLIKEAINDKIFVLLSRNFDFKRDLENALYINQEKLTYKEFILENKLERPTIGNWIKDFIKKNGAEMFDNLTLSQYITTSENAKKLDTGELQLLRKLLIVYRNIKFFPESMPSDNGDGWEIIPIDYKIEERSKLINIKEPQKKEQNNLQKENKIENKNNQIEDKKLNQNKNFISEPQKDQEINFKKIKSGVESTELEELKKLAAQYPKDSLEYRAIKEEMRHLIKKIN